MEDRTGRPVVTAQHTDRFIVDDDDMDSDIDAESELSLESRSFLHRVNDHVRKRQNQSSKDATQRQPQTFFNMVNVDVFNIGSICVHVKGFTDRSETRETFPRTETIRSQFPWSCHSRSLIWLFGYQFLRYVEHLFHSEIFCIFDGMQIVWVNLSDDHKHQKSRNKIDLMKDIDSVPSNVQSARQEALLYVFEDNEAVIKMII